MKTCDTCLNAYNAVGMPFAVECWNKDFEHQSDIVERGDFSQCSVRKDETCDQYTPRRSDQPKLVWDVQLSLF